MKKYLFILGFLSLSLSAHAEEVLNPVAIIDAQAASGYREVGVWSTLSGGLNGSCRLHAAPDSPPAYADYQFSGIGMGRFEVFVSYVARPENAPQVTYNILTKEPIGVMLPLTFTIDQRVAPIDGIYQGTYYRSIGIYNLKSVLEVWATKPASGDLIADSVLFVAR